MANLDLKFLTFDSCIQAARAMDYTKLERCKQAGIHFTSQIIDVAIETGSSDLVDWLLERGGEWTIEQSNHAARRGKMRIIAWAIRKGVVLAAQTAVAAAFANHPEIVKTLHAGGVSIAHAGIAAGAARYDDLEFLKWIKDNGGVLDDGILFNALMCDHPIIADWAYENGCRWGIGRASDLWLSPDMATKMQKYRH
jgi:hypothetical protein